MKFILSLLRILMTLLAISFVSMIVSIIILRFGLVTGNLISVLIFGLNPLFFALGGRLAGLLDIVLFSILYIFYRHIHAKYNKSIQTILLSTVGKDKKVVAENTS